MSFRTDKSFSLYLEIKDLTETAKTVIIPNGETWEINRFTGDANPNQDTAILLVWDYEGESEEIIAAVYGSTERRISRRFTGDGSKRLAIVIKNMSLNLEVLGGKIEVAKVE